MSMNFISDVLTNINKYQEWFIPQMNQATPFNNESNFQVARLVTNLGATSDLIEVNIETASYYVFRKQHKIRLIRGIFPEPETNNKVICFRIASSIPECSGLKMILAQNKKKESQDKDDKTPAENKLNVFLDIEPSHRHQNFFNPQNSTACKIGHFFMKCFANLETFLNLEYETRL